MSLFAIIVIIILGIFLLLIEFLVIPGFTIFGAAGFLFMIMGIGASYYFHGETAGNITLISTIFASLITIYYIFKKRTWQNMGLKASIDSRHEPFDTISIKTGDTGITVTRLAPVGKARVNDIICEAKSTGGFINENTEIEVIRVLTTQIIVKPKI